MKWRPEPNAGQLAIQQAAMTHTAEVLLAAAACRSAAQLAHQHPRSIPDAVIAEVVARFDSLLKAALNSVPQARDP